MTAPKKYTLAEIRNGTGWGKDVVFLPFLPEEVSWSMSDDARRIIAIYLPTSELARSWGLPPVLEEDGWTEDRWTKALAEVEEVLYG